MKKQFLLGLMAISLPLATFADSFVVKTKTMTYQGNAIVEPEVYASEEANDPLQKGTDYSVAYSGQSTKLHDAGEYQMVITGSGEYESYDETTIPLTVRKADLLVTIAGVKKTYGDSDDTLTPNFYVSGYKSGDNEDNVTISGLKILRKESGEHVGSYLIGLAEGSAEADNYNIKVTGQAYLEIVPKELNVTFSGLTWTYGETEEMLSNVKVTGEGDKSDYVLGDTDEKVVLSWEYVTAGTTVHNAETYPIRATIESNDYTLVNPNANIVVNPAMLTVKAKDYTKTYGMNDPSEFETESVGEYKYDEDKTNVKVTLARNDKGEDADTYTIDLCTVNSTNYVVEYTEKATLTIEPKSLADEEKPISVAFSGDKTYQGKNYELADGVITVTYNDKEIDQNKDLTLTTDYTIEVSETRNAGETVSVTIKAVNGGNYKDEAQISFEIEKASLTLAVATQTITFDANQDAIDQIEKTVSDSYITATGLVGDDQLTDLGIEFSLNPEVTVTIGDNKECIVIEAKSDIAKNYDIKYEYGTLTVGTGKTSGNSITIGRDIANTHELLRAYNGYKTFDEEGKYVVSGGFTVTIKEDRTIKAKQWYSMVLPFDISVRDFSRMMGYAVVDVPSYTPSSTGDPSFVLHFDVIKANTLFLFKTDNDVNMSKGLTFELQRSGNNKIGDGLVVIDYQPEYAFEDAAGNIFQGIYEPKEVSESGYWGVGSGAFIDAGVYFDKWQKAMALPALTGYVKTVGSENARIFVQEPDGSTTIINAINADAATNAEGWYTIGGVKLEGQPTQPGVYINNGKKVVIK